MTPARWAALLQRVLHAEQTWARRYALGKVTAGDWNRRHWAWKALGTAVDRVENWEPGTVEAARMVQIDREMAAWRAERDRSEGVPA